MAALKMESKPPRPPEGRRDPYPLDEEGRRIHRANKEAELDRPLGRATHVHHPRGDTEDFSRAAQLRAIPDSKHSAGHARRKPRDASGRFVACAPPDASAREGIGSSSAAPPAVPTAPPVAYGDPRLGPLDPFPGTTATVDDGFISPTEIEGGSAGNGGRGLCIRTQKGKGSATIKGKVDDFRNNAAAERQGDLLLAADTVRRVAPLLGIGQPLTFDAKGQKSCTFPCPFNVGARGRFVRSDDDRFYFRTILGGTPRFYSLAAAYAWRCAGAVWKHGEGERVSAGVWLTRLFAQAGLLGLPDLVMRPLPASATPKMHSFWEAVQLLIRCRELMFPGCGSPLARGFLGPWTGLPDSTAGRYRQALIDADRVERVHVRGRTTYYRAYGYPARPEWIAHISSLPRRGDDATSAA